MSWSRRFEDPPKRQNLVTMKDAAAFIMALPKSKQQSPEWQAPAEALGLAAAFLDVTLPTLDFSFVAVAH